MRCTLAVVFPLPAGPSKKMDASCGASMISFWYSNGMIASKVIASLNGVALNGACKSDQLEVNTPALPCGAGQPVPGENPQ